MQYKVKVSISRKCSMYPVADRRWRSYDSFVPTQPFKYDQISTSKDCDSFFLLRKIIAFYLSSWKNPVWLKDCCSFSALHFDMFPSQRAIRLAQVVAKRFLYCNPGRAAAVSAGRQCSVVLFSTAAIGQGKGYDPTPNDIRDNPIGNAPPSPDSPRLLKAKTSPHLSTYSQRQLQQTVQVSNNWIRTFATTNTILNKMGQSYKLLCLENPLLGKSWFPLAPNLNVSVKYFHIMPPGRRKSAQLS